MDYEKLRQSSEFIVFQEETSKLAQLDLRIMDANETKAFFLNIYNTLTIHALANSVTNEKEILELKGFWQINAYKIDAYTFTLDEIEHGILRCNKKHPTTNQCYFLEEDSRKEFVQQYLDPRIHFALNCGAKSCPAIRFYSAENINKSLDIAAEAFCQNDISIDLDDTSVVLSKIFLWYGQDFGQDEKSILLWIMEYLTHEQKTLLMTVMEKEQFKVKYRDYIWNIT